MGTLVREARRRILRNELFAQGAHASSAALAAFILLLLFGTEILSVPLVLGIPLAAIAIGWYRTRKRMPGPYAVAQIIDHRMGLADALSTATYFFESRPDSESERAAGEAEIREAQRAQAGRLAETVSARQAIPYLMPRGMYLAVALAVAAASLFALRYGLARRLDLKQPLANFLPESLRSNKRAEEASNRKKNPKSAPQLPDENGQPTDQNEISQADQDQNQETQTAGESDPQNLSANAKSPGKQKGDQPDSQMATDDSQPGDENNAGKNGEEGQEGQQGDSKNSQSQNQDGKQDAKNQSESSSLMDKMKDAVQNLMSKMKSQPQDQKGQQGQDQKGQQGKSPQGSKQQNGKDGQQQKDGQQGDAQDGESGDDAKNNENAQQQKGQGKSDSQQNTKQPGSGVGSQDGEKAIKNAEQLAAMGKLTEILGKRSQNITGEATVEVQSTSQQLRTPYANKGAEHTQGGAEINRDEVPVALQPYVQQYFEQIRKSAPVAPPKK